MEAAYSFSFGGWKFLSFFFKESQVVVVFSFSKLRSDDGVTKSGSTLIRSSSVLMKDFLWWELSHITVLHFNQWLYIDGRSSWSHDLMVCIEPFWSWCVDVKMAKSRVWIWLFDFSLKNTQETIPFVKRWLWAQLEKKEKKNRHRREKVIWKNT